MKKEMRARLYEAYRYVYRIWRNADEMARYSTGKVLLCFEVRGKLVPIEKHDIETAFPFGYDEVTGTQTQEKALEKARLVKTDTNFFRTLNHRVAGYAKIIQNIIKPTGKWIAVPMYHKCFGEDSVLYNIVEISENALMSGKEGYFELTKKELYDYRKVLGKCAKLHDKKISNYLNKYGLTKVESWTYDSWE